MGFCAYCGSYIAEEEKKCPACGKRADGAGGVAFAESEQAGERKERKGKQEKKETAYASPAGKKERYSDKESGKWNEAGEKRASGESGNTEINKGMAVLSYIHLLFIIPLILKREDPFVRFHLNQGIILFIAGLIVEAMAWMPLLSGIGGLFILYCFITSLINVSQGKMVRMPIIGQFQILK